MRVALLAFKSLFGGARILGRSSVRSKELGIGQVLEPAGGPLLLLQRTSTITANQEGFVLRLPPCFFGQLPVSLKPRCQSFRISSRPR